jgi:hypothetical protein
MRTACLVVLLAGGFTAGTPALQQNLSGTWVATKDAPTGAGPAPTAVFGDRFGVALSGNTVVLTRPRGTTVSTVMTLPLDGTEVAVTSPGRPCFADSVQSIAAVRQANGFAYTTKAGPGFTFRSEGDTLIVEATVRDANGPRQVGTVYRRSATPTEATLPPPAKGPNVTVAPATIDALGWLAGDWVGTIGGNHVEERWMAAAGGSMIGNSRSTRGTPAQMVEFEYLCIAQRAGGLVYTAMPNGGGTTDFLLTKVSADSVTFENPDHDFPRAITYTRRPDGGYDATISGAPGQRALTWSFKKK